MSDNSLAALPWARLALQPGDAHDLSESERDTLIISATLVEGQWVILSRYGDDFWHLENFTSNVSVHRRRLEFSAVPKAFRGGMKAMFYRYLRRGRAGQQRPKGATLYGNFQNTKYFLRHLLALGIEHLSAVTPFTCATYVEACRAHRQTGRSLGKALSQDALRKRLIAVEALYELSQYTDDAMPQQPWPETSAMAMAGLVGSGSPHNNGGKTPLISDAVFCTLFERAHRIVESGNVLLDLRNALDAIAARLKKKTKGTVWPAKSRHLAAHGWEGGLDAFNHALVELRTACYIVLASTSGCRNHELANLQSNAHLRTHDDEGNVYHWMRSRSDKTDAGIYDWMIPETAVRALRLMERWAAPYQNMIAVEVAELRRTNPHDPQITEAQKHRQTLFLGVSSKNGKQARALSNRGWNQNLKAFAKDCGLDWNLASHQFRRKFANYAAHSRFGDLRYLKEHYAHWSLDMSLGYAMDASWGQHLDAELFMDIQNELDDIKLGVAEVWIAEPLAGGYGRAIKQWQRDPRNLAIFKNHAAMVKSIAESTSIRSNGHAWCTADNDGCVGNTLERTRCGDCDNAVIGCRHADIYQLLYDDLKGMLDCPGIGEGGRQRVLRDMARSRDVLIQLGIDPETRIA
jgi:hypothetical protein